MRYSCCRLSAEKALKGLYLARLGIEPPRVHNLVYFLNKAGVKPPESIGRFIVKLNEANIATRYPDNIDRLQKDYTQPVVSDILEKSKELLLWIKKLL